MRPESYYFDVTPRVVAADVATEITIVSKYHDDLLRDGQEYDIAYYPAEEIALKSGWQPHAMITATARNGELRFTHFFEGEQEHVLVLNQMSADRKRPVEFRLYSVMPDLYALRPYKGDLHIHSRRSDGWEPPAYVAAAARRLGMDFMAVTDHLKYEPSLEAIAAFAELPIDLRIYPGEEIHPPDNPVHMINFGGRFSINELFEDESYLAGLDQTRQCLPPAPPGVNPNQYASCVWCFNKIREAGGLGIFCHPYWMTSYRYSPAGALTTHLFETQPFDAFELIGGFFPWEAESNTLQVARYNEERAQGRKIPIVASSDTHGCERGELFGWFYTIAFARSPELPDLIDSVKNLRSVAVEAMAGEMTRPYGPFRMVKYALFLVREYFPEHDRICRWEGELMLEHLAGSRDARERLAAAQGGVAAHMRQFWAV